MCPAERRPRAAPETGSERELLHSLDRLAADLSSALIQLPADQIAESMKGTLRLIVEALGVDRGTVMLCDQTGTAFEAVHCWARPGIPTAEVRMLQEALPWYSGSLMRGETLIVESVPEDMPVHATSDRAFVQQQGIKSFLTIPIAVASRCVCALSVGSFRSPRTWSTPVVERLRFIAEIIAAAVHRGSQDRLLNRTIEEHTRLTSQLGSGTVYREEETRDVHGVDDIIGDSPLLRAALEQVQEVAPTGTAVLLLGETGTGKELFARAVHQRSPRRLRALIRVNCAALPAALIESELFGHERGAFTGAVSTRQGRFELADHGTIFLDEIGDLPPELQTKLLRVLQEGEFERLGSSHTRKVDVRVVAATHRDLNAAVAGGTFRADLYYRLSVFPIRLPSLRERPEDIPRLVWFLIHQRKRTLHRQITKVPAQAMRALQSYEWPGNVRELQNVIERSMIRSTGDTLMLDQDPAMNPARAATTEAGTLEAVERRHIQDVLRRAGWRINGPGNAAEQLGLHPNTLRFRMKKLQIGRPAPASRRPAAPQA